MREVAEGDKKQYVAASASKPTPLPGPGDAGLQSILHQACPGRCLQWQGDGEAGGKQLLQTNKLSAISDSLGR